MFIVILDLFYHCCFRSFSATRLCGRFAPFILEEGGGDFFCSLDVCILRYEDKLPISHHVYGRHVHTKVWKLLWVFIGSTWDFFLHHPQFLLFLKLLPKYKHPYRFKSLCAHAQTYDCQFFCCILHTSFLISQMFMKICLYLAYWQYMTVYYWC